MYAETLINTDELCSFDISFSVNHLIASKLKSVFI